MEGINSLSSGYIAFVLQAESREEVLHRFPSRFEEIRAEHVTYLYGVNANTAMPAAGVLTVLAYVSDQSLEALMKLGISAIALQISSILTFAYGTFKSLEDFVSFHALAGHLGTSLIIVGAVFLTVALKRIAESQHTE